MRLMVTVLMSASLLSASCVPVEDRVPLNSQALLEAMKKQNEIYRNLWVPDNRRRRLKPESWNHLKPREWDI